MVGNYVISYVNVLFFIIPAQESFVFEISVTLQRRCDDGICKTMPAWIRNVESH